MGRKQTTKKKSTVDHDSRSKFLDDDNNNNNNNDDDDWLSRLAKATVEKEKTQIPNKELRVRRRQAKLLEKRKRQGAHSDDEHHCRKRAGKTKGSMLEQRQTGIDLRRTMTDSKSERLKRRLVVHLKENSAKWNQLIREKKKKGERSSAMDENGQVLGTIGSKRGKATKHNQVNESNVQPRHGAYGGIGLARESLFIALSDPSFVPKLEHEFSEHIPGFFGKQRKNAMKNALKRERGKESMKG